MKERHIIITSALSVAVLTAAGQQRTSMGFVYPAGAQRGTTVEVTVGGQNLSNAVGMTFGGRGVTAERIEDKGGQQRRRPSKGEIGEEDNLQLADQIRFRVTIAPDAEPGLRDVRLEGRQGLSNRLFFEVGTLPDVLEKEPNDAEGNRLDKLPVTVCGQVMRSDADRFTFAARKGQAILLRVQGRVFIPYIADAVPGWFQPVLRLFDASGREVAYEDDYRFQVDPVMIFRAPADGDYTAEIRDALFRGREDFTYRIDIGELPFITSVFPLGGQVGGKAEVTLSGVNLPRGRMKLASSRQETQAVQVETPSGYYSNKVLFERTDLASKPWKPNLSRSTAMPLASGQAVDAVMAGPMQEHWYAVRADGRGQLMFEVKARRLGSPADMKMTIYAPDGKQLAEVDDVDDPEEPLLTHHADPVSIQRIEKPGIYMVRLSETQGNGGADYAYRFKVYRPEVDFSLAIEPSSLSIPSGGSALLTMTASRRNGFNGRIDVSVEGLPEGFETSPGVIPPGSKKLFMTVTAPHGVPEGNLNLKVKGSVEQDGKQVARYAQPVESMMQAFYYTHMLPISDFRSHVGPEQPFSVTVETGGQPVALARQGTTSLKVNISRREGFAEPVTITLRSADRSVTAEAVVAEVASDHAELKLKCTGKGASIVPVVITAMGRIDNKRTAGQNRQAFNAAVTVLAPVVLTRQPSSAKNDRRDGASRDTEKKTSGKDASGDTAGKTKKK